MESRFKDLQPGEGPVPQEAPGPKWFVHIVGPDDVIEKCDELDALRSANAVNVQIEREQAKHASNPNHPFMIAIARKEGDIEIEFDPKYEDPDEDALIQLDLSAKAFEFYYTQRRSDGETMRSDPERPDSDRK